MREHTTTINVDLVADGDVVAEHRHVLEARPLADGAVPADDGALDPRVVLDPGTREERAPLQAHAVADHDALADDHVGADAAVLADLGGLVDHDVAAVDVALGRRDQQVRLLLGEGGKIQTGARQEVLGLADVHPEALEIKRVQQAVADDGREGLLLDRGGSVLLDAAQHRRVEHVQARVDAVADELDGLLDEPVDARGVVGLVHDDAVFRGLLDLGHDDGALVAVRLVELGQLLEGELAGHVRIQHEEGRVVLSENLFRELEGAGRAEGFVLEGEVNLDT